jgi:hypothetical protein
MIGSEEPHDTEVPVTQEDEAEALLNVAEMEERKGNYAQVFRIWRRSMAHIIMLI